MQTLMKRIKSLNTTKKIAIAFVSISFIFIITITVVNMIQGNYIETEDKIVDNKNTSQNSKKQETLNHDDKQELEEANNDVKENEEINTSTNQNTIQNSQNQNVPNQDGKDSSNTVIDEPAVDYVSVNVVIYGLQQEVIASGSVSLEKGKSVFDALQLFATKQNIALTTTGYGSFVYVSGINGLKEKDYGGSSGWVYLINNERVMSGAGRYTINENVNMEWKYVYD